MSSGANWRSMSEGGLHNTGGLSCLEGKLYTASAKGGADAFPCSIADDCDVRCAAYAGAGGLATGAAGVAESNSVLAGLFCGNESGSATGLLGIALHPRTTAPAPTGRTGLGR